MEIKDSVAVVTGGASGLGVTASGCSMPVRRWWSSISQGGEEVVAGLGERARFVAANV